MVDSKQSSSGGAKPATATSGGATLASGANAGNKLSLAASAASATKKQEPADANNNQQQDKNKGGKTDVNNTKQQQAANASCEPLNNNKQQEQINRKLSANTLDSAHFLKPSNTEINNNNNTVACSSSPSSSSETLRDNSSAMDATKRKSTTTAASGNDNATTKANVEQSRPGLFSTKSGVVVACDEQQQQQQQQRSTPAYTSIFDPPTRLAASAITRTQPNGNAHAQQQQQQQQSANSGGASAHALNVYRGPLRKQIAADIESPRIARRALYTSRNLHQQQQQVRQTQLDDEELESLDTYNDDNNNSDAARDECTDEDDSNIIEDYADERQPLGLGAFAITKRPSSKQLRYSDQHTPQYHLGTRKQQQQRFRDKAEEARYYAGAARGAPGKARKLAATMASDNTTQAASDSLKHQDTKISIYADSRPPSFNTCHPSPAGSGHNGTHGAHHVSRTDLVSASDSHGICMAKCDCTSCHKKRKLAMLDADQHHHHHHQQHIGQHHKSASAEFYARKHQRLHKYQQYLHCIILVLLLILLLMIVGGMILASYHLPHMFDRLLNVSRSFNVTIAG